MRLADYAASYVDKNTAVLSLCRGRTKTTQASLSCCCALDAVIRNDSRSRRCPAAPQLGCSSNLPAPVPGDRPRDPRELSVIKVHGWRQFCWDSSLWLHSHLCFVFLFFLLLFFFLSVSPDFTLHGLRVRCVITRAGSLSRLMT